MKPTKKQKLDPCMKYTYRERMVMLKKRVKLITMAIEAGDTEIVEAIVKSGITLDDFKRWTVSPLYVAIDNENMAMVKYLLDNGASADLICKKGTPLHRALARNKLDIAELLAQRGAVLRTYAQDYDSMIQHAVRFASPDTLGWVLRHGFDPNTRLCNNMTPLEMLRNSNSVCNTMEKIDLLIKHGMNVLDIENALSLYRAYGDNVVFKHLEKQRLLKLRRVMYKSMFGQLPKEVFRIVESFLYS